MRSFAPPSEWIVRWCHLVPSGARVLDLACGSGRHAGFLAARGARVLAADRDAAALAGLARVDGVETLEADLEGAPWPFEPATFDAIVVTNYLHRPRFTALAATLRAGGVLLYETFMRGNERYGKPSNPDFLLAPGELLEAFGPALVPVAFEQGLRPGSVPAVIQRAVLVHRNAAGAFDPKGLPGAATPG